MFGASNINLWFKTNLIKDLNRLSKSGYQISRQRWDLEKISTNSCLEGVIFVNLVGILLPKPTHCPVRFMKEIIQGKKKVFELTLVRSSQASKHSSSRTLSCNDFETSLQLGSLISSWVQRVLSRLSWRLHSLASTFLDNLSFCYSRRCWKGFRECLKSLTWSSQRRRWSHLDASNVLWCVQRLLREAR